MFRRILAIALLLLLQLLVAAPGAQASDETNPAAVRPAPNLGINEIELGERMIENSKRSLALNAQFSQHIQELLKAADSYDVETYRKADDDLSDVIQQLEANYLEYTMLLQVAPPEQQNLPETKQFLATIKESLQNTRMSTSKSSAIFYLCFGLPVQSCHYSRLSLSLAQANPRAADKLSDILFYAGAGALWSGDYKTAEEELEEAMQLDQKNQFAGYYLGETYLAERQPARAIESLQASLKTAETSETRGNLSRALALAYTLNNQKPLARQFIEAVRRELDNDSVKQFKGIAKESVGIASALAGNFDTAERQLSDALPILQMSPINLGNRLEAGQAALWRSYCREKLGDRAGASEDRRYALNISDEASHLSHLAGMLDPLFGHREAVSPVGQIKERFAIVVGVGNFADPQVPRLHYPPKDASDMRDFLVANAGFANDHIKLLVDKDATRAGINDCLTGQWLTSAAKPGDLVFLFVSSHGTPAYKEIGAFNSLVTYDTRLDHLFTTSMPLQNLVRTIRRKLKKQHVFVVLDTCYSGGLGAPGTEAKSSSNIDPELMVISNHQLLVSSSSSSERSWESKRYQNSVFTRQMIETLAKNPRYDDFRSLFPEIVRKVNTEVQTDFKYSQTPTLAGRWSGKGLIKRLLPRAAILP